MTDIVAPGVKGPAQSPLLVPIAVQIAAADDSLSASQLADRPNMSSYSLISGP